jgi:predicted DNA-binding transcriptional regulator YafY
MRRADRLFQLVQLLRRRRLTTAAQLAETLEVSERTVYRDIRDLTLSGVPIRGEAGVGYALSSGFDLPPLMFTEEEVEALVLGARVVQAAGDPALARAADGLLAKVELVLPERLRHRINASPLFAPHVRAGSRVPHLGLVRSAIHERRRLRFAYVDKADTPSQRRVRPLALAFWGHTWTLATWCEQREAFRSFRLDRMSDVTPLPERFPEEPGRTLDDFIREVARAPEHARR